MNMVSTVHRYTPEDLLSMPDGECYELEDGQLVEREVSNSAAYVASEINLQIRQFCKSRLPGWVFSESASFRCFFDHPDRVRRADSSYIALERMTVEQYQALGHINIAPDLVVEVISPNGNAYSVDRKIEEWLRAGVKLIWLVNPDIHTVCVFRVDVSATLLRESQELSGEEILPGFLCPVAELFRLPVSN